MLQPSAFGEPGLIRTGDGRRLHRVTLGSGGPTVVFEAGLGAGRGTWGLVQPAVAGLTRTIAYDRAGLGRSDPARAPRTLDRMAGDLTELLEADGQPPYVLVGHSLGGPIVRSLAARRPDLVAGLVLVDQVAEDCAFYYQRSRTAGAVLGYRIATGLAACGLLERLFGPAVSGPYPPDMAAELRAEQLSTTAMRTSVDEMTAMAAGLRGLLGQELPDVPVTLISGGRSGPLERRIRPVLVASHRRLAAGLAQGRHVVAADSGHLVPADQPDIIIPEIRRLVESIRARTASS